MAIVYKHIKADTKELFYIGIGLSKKRAYSFHSRNKLWYNIVNKHGLEHEIIFNDIDIKLAKQIEVYLISYYGRLDNNSGILANMTNGGDGAVNLSIESRNRISKSLTGKKQSHESNEKRKQSLKKTWENQELRDLKRKQTNELIAKGVINTKGRISKYKGLPFTGDKLKLSESLKEYYKNNKPHNFKILPNYLIESINNDYKSGVNKYNLHKKYDLNRKIIDRVLCN